MLLCLKNLMWSVSFPQLSLLYSCSCMHILFYPLHTSLVSLSLSLFLPHTPTSVGLPSITLCSLLSFMSFFFDGFHVLFFHRGYIRNFRLKPKSLWMGSLPILWMRQLGYFPTININMEVTTISFPLDIFLWKTDNHWEHLFQLINLSKMVSYINLFLLTFITFHDFSQSISKLHLIINYC